MIVINFPEEAAALIKLANEDQQEVRGHQLELEKLKSSMSKQKAAMQLALHARQRVNRMTQLLTSVPALTLSNIGLDGSKAVVVLTLHSYLDIMKRILALFEQAYSESPNDVYAAAIPPLCDRIAILESRTQVFGTNWMPRRNGQPYLIPVKEFDTVNMRRRQYGLEPIKRPVNLAKGSEKYPLGLGQAKASDQKPMTDNEYEEYARYYISPRSKS